MPTIYVRMFEGRTAEQKRKLVKTITDAVVDSLGVAREGVRVVIFDVPKSNFAVGGILASDK